MCTEYPILNTKYKFMRIKKQEEGLVEIFLNLFMPIWLPLKAISIMIKEMREEKRKRRETEEK